MAEERVERRLPRFWRRRLTLGYCDDLALELMRALSFIGSPVKPNPAVADSPSERDRSILRDISALVRMAK